jgi:MarR family transcriptional regulator, 2-MHQ and catechol-resistance regulon repressor
MPTHYDGNEREKRALNAYITLMRASDACFAVLERELGPHELSSTRLGVLEALLHLGPLCQGELSQKLLRTGASTTSVVAGLEKRGLVVRQRTSEDRRFVRVALTSKGRKLIEGVFPGHVQSICRVLGTLTGEEQEELRRLCRKLGRAVA